MDKLVINGLTFRYKNSGPDIIKDLDFTLQPETFNVLYGPSGCGKSTLMKIIAGLYPEFSGHVTSGKMYIDSEDVDDWNTQDFSKHVAFLFQNPNDQFSMTTVKREFIFTLENIGLPIEQIEETIDRSLERVGILKFKDRKLDTLSGGELQKVSLAITLAMNSDLIMLDEPFACIDIKSRKQLLELLKDLQENDHKTILITDHDLMGYQGIVDDLYHFDNGQVQPVLNPAEVFATYQKENRQLLFDKPGDTVESIIDLHELNLQNGAKSLINSASVDVFKGKMILLTGENGTGKSTLFSALTRLHDYRGSIKYLKKDILKYNQRKYARYVGLIFQDSQMQYLKLTVEDEIKLSLKHTNYPDFWTDDVVEDYLKQLNLAHLKDHVVYQLSGGQKKKLQIFEMLILGDPVLLMDEPLAGLDLHSTKTVMKLIKEVASEQELTVLMISHQLGGLQDFFDYHLQLKNQCLTYTEVLNFESIS